METTITFNELSTLPLNELEKWQEAIEDRITVAKGRKSVENSKGYSIDEVSQMADKWLKE